MDDPDNEKVDTLAGSVTMIYREFSGGDSAAGAAIYRSCFPRFCNYAKKLLSRNRCLSGDEEDVVQSALGRFCNWLKKEQHSSFNRNDFENILASFVRNKALEFVRKSNAAKRGGGKSTLNQADIEQSAITLDELASVVPTSEFDCWFKELVESLSSSESNAGQADLDEFFLLKLAGYTIPEIAETTNVSTATVERKLKLARTRLMKKLEDE